MTVIDLQYVARVAWDTFLVELHAKVLVLYSGKIIKKVTRGLSNFVAKFDIDSDVALLSLESKDYDTDPDGAYEAWMILEPTDEGAVEAAEADGAAEQSERRYSSHDG